MGYSFKDYIKESTKYMYDDNCIVEDRSTILKSWEERLKREQGWLDAAIKRNDTKAIKRWQKSVKHAKQTVSDLRLSHGNEPVKKEPNHTHEVKMDAYFDSVKDHRRYAISAKEHGLKVVKLNHDGWDNSHLQGSKENLEKFIKRHHDDGTGEPEELNHIKEIK